jgi:uncharacterized protein YerC
MLNNKELNEKIKAFFNTKEKSNLRQTEILMKNAFSSDYLMYDVVNFISLIKDDQEFINYIGLENLENKVIETNNEVCIGALIDNIEGVNIQKLEDAVINMKNAFILFNFARITVNTNKEKLENAIIEIKNAKKIYNFARYIKGANIEKLENAIIEIKNAEYIYLFARDVKGANMYKCLYEIKKLNSQNNFSDLEISLEINIILRDLASIHNCVDTEEKKQVLIELISNRYEDNNEIKLGVYFDYLNNPEATNEDLDKCDKEYLDYMCSLEEVKLSDKKKVKIRKKEIN